MSTLQNIYSPMDELCLDTFCSSTTPIKYTKLNAAKTASCFINRHEEIYDLVHNYIFKRFSDINENTTLNEILYRIKYNINIIPKCPVCGSNIKFKNFNIGYGVVCSPNCNMKDDKIIKKFKESIKKHNSKIDHDLTIISNENDDYILQTFLLKRKNNIIADGNKCDLHCKWPTKHKEEINYILNRFNDTTNIYEVLYRLYHKINCNPGCKVCGKPVKFISFTKGYNRTCSHSCKTLLPETREKLLQTVNRLNSENPNRPKEIKTKAINTFKLHILNEPTYFTTDKTIFLSKPEKLLKDILCEIYGNDDVLMHYRDKRYLRKWDHYLFECDFYIKSLDLFLECQIFPAHGGHPYDKNNINDKNKLHELKEKAKIFKLNNPNRKKSLYDDFIYVWTKYDTLKRNVAKKNNLNYIELFDNNFTKENIYNIITTYFSSK